MIDTELLGKLAAALAKAQAAYPAILRSASVTVPTKAGSSYTYDYAPLDVILAAVRGPLAANGLAITQLLLGSELVTMLIHESGAYLESRIALPQSGDIKQWGGEITYRRRYAIQALAGVAAEEDTDAASGPQKGTQKRQGQPAVTRPAAPPRDPVTILRGTPGDDTLTPESPTTRQPANGHTETGSTSAARVKVTTGAWAPVVAGMVERGLYKHPRHVVNAAALEGFAVIGDDNLGEVVTALEKHAAERDAQPEPAAP